MIQMFTKKRNKKGFTLIELIVVVAILGILAAIAIPRFTSVRTGAQDAANAATVRTVNSAWQVYQAEGGSASGKTWPGDYIADVDSGGSETSVVINGLTVTRGATDAEWK